MPVTDSTDRGQLRIFPDLDTPARFVGQMPVENIHTEGSHNIQILFHLLLTEEMTAFIQHKTSPAITGLICNLTSSHCSFSKTGQLFQGLFRIEKAGFRRGFQ